MTQKKDIWHCYDKKWQKQGAPECQNNSDYLTGRCTRCNISIAYGSKCHASKPNCRKERVKLWIILWSIIWTLKYPYQICCYKHSNEEHVCSCQLRLDQELTLNCEANASIKTIWLAKLFRKCVCICREAKCGPDYKIESKTHASKHKFAQKVCDLNWVVLAHVINNVLVVERNWKYH